MTGRIVSEPEFESVIAAILEDERFYSVGSVTGPGRSGAVAAVYASHILRVPYFPFGARCPRELGRLLIIDTAQQSGKTLRKAARKYEQAHPIVVACFNEPPRVSFWYEACNPKPQRYRHERAA